MAVTRDWKSNFQEGVRLFQEERYEESLLFFDAAIELDNTKKHAYDSRAAAFDKLNRPRDALKDSRKCIEIDPDSWHGYARSARLFMKLGKFPAAAQMAEHALARIKGSDEKRKNEMTLLKQEAERLQTLRPSKTKTNYFDRLPTEICDMIFNFFGGKTPHKIIPLSLVCRRWRDIIWNIPFVWRELTLTPRSRVKEAENWLQRSHRVLRTLRIRSGFHADNRPGMAKVLASVAWEKLETLESGVLPHDLGRIIAVDKVCLRELKLDLHGVTNNAGPYGPRVWKTLLDMNWSRLTSLHLILCILFPQELLLSFSTLQRLVITEEPSFKAPILYQLLDKNRHLKELVCDRQRYLNLTEESIDDFQKISLEELSVLEFHNNSTLLLQIFKKIEVPNLTTLRISYVRVPLISRHLDRLFSMRLDHLTELSLVECIVDEHRLNQFLRGLPSLSRLTLNTLHYTPINDTVTFLSTPFCTESGESCIPCPKLEFVDLSSHSQLLARPVVNLVKAHLPSPERPKVIPIRNLILNDCEAVDSEALPWLRKQVEHVSCLFTRRRQI